MQRNFLKAAVFFAVALAMADQLAAADQAGKPNIVYMMLDEWGYYEMSGLGHQKLKTPVFDAFLKEGMRFTQLLCGRPDMWPDAFHAPDRAASRACFDALQRRSHADTCRTKSPSPKSSRTRAIGRPVSGNGASVRRGTTGIPEIHGFDLFFGYYDQVHAHTFLSHVSHTQ